MTNPSAPSAVVKPFGPTEAVSILVTLGGLLAALFGRDWGISRHAEQIVSAGYLVGPVIFGSARALKHHAATGAAAMVYVADAAVRSAAPASVPVPVSQNVTVVQPPAPPADLPPEPPADAYPGTPPAAAPEPAPPAEPAPTGGSVQVTAPPPAQPEPPAADTPAATAIPVAPLPAQPTPTAPYAGSPADTGPAFAT